MIGIADHSRMRRGHFDAVDVGQAQVEDDQVRAVVGGVTEAALAGGGFDRPCSLLLERDAQELLERRLVFDHQDGGALVGHVSSTQAYRVASTSGRLCRPAAA